MYRKVLMPMLIGILALSGCGQSDNSITETAGHSVHEEVHEDLAETKESDPDSAETEYMEKEDENAGLSEIPVNTRKEEIHYYCEDDTEILNARRRCVSDGENIYLVYYSPDLYVMPIGTGRQSPVNIENPEGMYACKIALDSKRRIHLLMTDPDNDKWLIWRLDESRQVDKVMDVSEYFDTKREPGWFLVDKEGNYYLQWSLKWNGVILDSEGVLKHSFTPKSLGIKGSYEAAVGKDGGIYLVCLNQDSELRVGAFDMDNCLVNMEASPFSFPDSETFSVMSAGTDTNLLLFSPFSGIWACDTEKGIMENRMSISDLNSGSGMDLFPLAFLADGRLLLGEMADNDAPEDVRHRILRYIPAGR